MKFHNQKSFMGHKISNVTNKPLLHKKGKQWIVVAVSALILAGFGGVVSTTTHADTTNNGVKTESAVSGQANGSANKVSQPNTQNITNQAGNLHKNLVNNSAKNMTNNGNKPVMLSATRPLLQSEPIHATSTGTWGTAKWELNNGTLNIHDGNLDGVNNFQGIYDSNDNNISGKGSVDSDNNAEQGYLDENAVNNITTKNVQVPSDCANLFSGDTGKWTGANPNVWNHFNKVQSIDLTGITNTNHISDMAGMFHGCGNLTNVKFGSNFDTSNVTNMSSMFDDDYNLRFLDMSSFNTHKVNNFGGMFWNTPNLISLDLANFDLSSVNNGNSLQNNMFTLSSGYVNGEKKHTPNLQQLVLNPKFNWKNAGINKSNINGNTLASVNNNGKLNNSIEGKNWSDVAASPGNWIVSEKDSYQSYDVTFTNELTGQIISDSNNTTIAGPKGAPFLPINTITLPTDYVSAPNQGSTASVNGNSVDVNVVPKKYAYDNISNNTQSLSKNGSYAGGQPRYIYGELPNTTWALYGDNLVIANGDLQSNAMNSDILNNKASIKEISIVHNVGAPSNTSYWLYGFPNATSVDLSGLKNPTSVKNMLNHNIQTVILGPSTILTGGLMAYPSNEPNSTPDTDIADGQPHPGTWTIDYNSASTDVVNSIVDSKVNSAEAVASASASSAVSSADSDGKAALINYSNTNQSLIAQLANALNSASYAENNSFTNSDNSLLASAKNLRSTLNQASQLASKDSSNTDDFASAVDDALKGAAFASNSGLTPSENSLVSTAATDYKNWNNGSTKADANSNSISTLINGLNHGSASDTIQNAINSAASSAIAVDKKNVVTQTEFNKLFSGSNSQSTIASVANSIASIVATQVANNSSASYETKKEAGSKANSIDVNNEINSLTKSNGTIDSLANSIATSYASNAVNWVSANGSNVSNEAKNASASASSAYSNASSYANSIKNSASTSISAVVNSLDSHINSSYSSAVASAQNMASGAETSAESSASSSASSAYSNASSYANTLSKSESTSINTVINSVNTSIANASASASSSVASLSGSANKVSASASKGIASNATRISNNSNNINTNSKIASNGISNANASAAASASVASSNAQSVANQNSASASISAFNANSNADSYALSLAQNATGVANANAGGIDNTMSYDDQTVQSLSNTVNANTISLANNDNDLYQSKENKPATKKHGTKIAQLHQPLFYFYALKPLWLHTSAKFTKGNRAEELSAKHGYTLPITRIFKVNGALRFEVKIDGAKYFVTGNRYFARNAYIQPNEVEHNSSVKVLKAIREYKRAGFGKKNFIKGIRKGTVLPIKQAKTVANKQVTRLQLTNGHWITANKNLVKLI